MVQGGPVPIEGSQGSSRRAARLRSNASGDDRHTGVGFDSGNQIFGRSDAASTHRGLERGRAGEPGHARQHDRDGPREIAEGKSLMDGAQDMGGVEGFGPVKIEPNEPLFHESWERRVFGMTLAMAKPGGWNIDMSRSAREDR